MGLALCFCFTGLERLSALYTGDFTTVSGGQNADLGFSHLISSYFPNVYLVIFISAGSVLEAGPSSECCASAVGTAA